MKNRVILLCLMAGAFLIGSCREEPLLTYENENNIYFPNRYYRYYNVRTAMMYNDLPCYSPDVPSRNTPQAQDSLGYTMANGNITIIPVRVMGKITDYDRPFAWRLTHQGEPEVGVEGVDFKVLDAYIPANGNTGGIIVQLFSENLNDDNYLYANFELLSNEHFQTNFSKVRSSGSTTSPLVSTLNMRLQFTDFLLPPQYWSMQFQPVLGSWSTKKISILIAYLGLDPTTDFLYRYPPPDIVQLLPYGVALRRWLEEYEMEHGEPCYEKDGVTEMRAGSVVYNF